MKVVVNPKTLDNVSVYGIMGVIFIVTLLGVIYIYKRKYSNLFMNNETTQFHYFFYVNVSKILAKFIYKWYYGYNREGRKSIC